MPPSSKSKNGSGEKDKIPVASPQQLLEELKAFKTALLIKETEHTWEAIDRAVKRFTAVTRGGGHRYEAEYVAGLKDRELAKAIVGTLSTERTQLSASTLLFLSAATRLGQAFAPLLFLYFPHIIRLLSRTNKLYISRATACLTVIIGNTRLAGVIPYLREGMLEKSATHRKGCIAGVLYALGGPDPLASTRDAAASEGMLVDKEIVRRRYIEDVETCIRIGARDKDIEVRQIAKKCWEIYRTEYSERVASFAGPLTPIARKYLELPPMGQPLPDYGQPPTASSLSKATQSIAGPSGSVSDGPPILQTRPRALPAAPRGPPPTKVAAPLNPVVHTVQRVPARMISSNSVTCVASQAEHTVRGGLPQSSASRPPPTLFARRVLPPSAATAPGFQGAELKHAPPPASLTTFTREQPTLTREQPVASTSYGSATTILPRNVGLDPAVQSSQPWLCHQRAVTVPADKSPSSGQIKLRAAEPEEMRPASACSLSSSVSTSLTSPSKEPFRPSSSASSRSRDNGDDQAWQAPTASTGHRPLATEHPAKPEVSQQRRTVPMQVHRAPTRATRRASRVLPPSTDLQAFLSSTATAAASDFQWPSTASATTRLPTTTAPVEIPTKRPASAMSSNSLSNSLVANAVTVVSVERSASPSGRQSPMHAHPADGALAKGTEVSEHVVETILRTPESNHDNSNLEAVSVALPNVPVENYAEPKSPSHEATQTPLTNVAVSTIDANPGVDHQVTSLAAESEASRFSEPAKVAQSVSMASLASLPDTLNGLAEEIAPQTDNSEGKAAVEEVRSSAISDMALSSEQVATLPNGSPAAPAGIDNVSKDAVRSVDIAALAANLPLAKGTPADDISRPVLAGNRQKTAFRPQKHHKPTEELAWIPLPTLTTDTLQMDTGASRSALSGSTANNADHATLTSAVREAKPSVPVQQQPLKSSLNLGRSPVPPEPVPREVRSVSAMTGSMPSHAKPADLLRSSHPVRAARPRQPVGAASRTLQVSDKAKPPPTKKQASSSSTGPRTERPRFGAGGGVARSLIPSDKPAVSASSSRLPASKASSARQGSIFSRLTAPTAASAGKAKPRIPSEAKETFKRPLPSSRPVNKKPSTMSLKSSQGAADRQPRPLKDETNIGSMSRVQETASVDGKGRKGTDEAVVSPQSQDDRGPLLAEGPSATLLADMAIAAENVKDSARVMKDNVSYEDGKEAGHSIAAVSMSTATLKSQEGLSSAGVPTLTSNAGPADTSPLLAAASIPLPSSPTPPAANEHPFQSTSILAELGFRPAGAFDANKVFTSPTALPVGPSSDGVGQRRLDQGPASPLPAHDHHLSADEEVPDLGRDRASMPDSEGNGQDTRNKSSMHNRSVDENTESFAMADATVIVHDLEELGLNSITETDVAVEQTQVPAETDGQLDREGPEVMTQPAELTDSVLSESESAPMKPNTQTVSDARVITSVDEHHASHSPVPADIPLPQDVTMTFDASLSMLASPTRGMQELLARSTGPQGLEERSPLLLEKEYLPEIGAGQYEYDETVLDAYSTTSGSAGTHPEKEAQATTFESKEAQLRGAAIHQNESVATEDDEEEDEIALLISRELSSDSLEELASRWEESRVIGSLGLLDQSNDDFDVENTPMRPKLLSRLSDGESSDYGSAPIGTATYTKDDEDAALDILLNLGQQGDIASWSENDKLLTESLLMMPGKVLPSRRGGAEDRHILAEMSDYADTPKVIRQKPNSDVLAGSSKKQEPTTSILREGGLV